MPDLQLLVLVLALLYLSECFVRAPRGSVVFHAWGAGKHQVVYPSRLLGNERGGFVFLNPLPPFGSYFLCPAWPLSLAKSAAYSYVAASTDPAGRPRQRARFIRFDEVRGIWPSGGDVLVNGDAIVKLADEVNASSIAELLTALWKQPEGDREILIGAALDRLLDTRAIERRLCVFASTAAPLRLWSSALFVLLLCVPALSIWIWRIRSNWPVLLLAIFLCLGAATRKFFAAHRQVFPRFAARRWRALATMVLMPTSAIRAFDVLSRYLLAEYHPLAVACVLCERRVFDAYARRVLLDLKHPRLPICPLGDDDRNGVEYAFRRNLVHRLEVMIAAAGHDVSELTAPPVDIEPGCVSFCPRCDLQYQIAEGVCADCGGIRLQRFAQASQESCAAAI